MDLPQTNHVADSLLRSVRCSFYFFFLDTRSKAGADSTKAWYQLGPRGYSATHRLGDSINGGFDLALRRKILAVRETQLLHAGQWFLNISFIPSRPVIRMQLIPSITASSLTAIPLDVCISNTSPPYTLCARATQTTSTRIQSNMVNTYTVTKIKSPKCILRDVC